MEPSGLPGGKAVNHCLRHYEEPVAAICRACNYPFCARCLVYSFGPKKAPFCVGCALHASGIRNGMRAVVPPATDPQDSTEAGPPAPMDRRTARATRRSERDAQKQAARSERKADRLAGPAPDVPAIAENGVDPEVALDAASLSQLATPTKLLSPVHHQL